MATIIKKVSEMGTCEQKRKDMRVYAMRISEIGECLECLLKKKKKKNKE